eukprot:424928_1
MSKNLKLKTRNIGGTIFEILIPVFMMFIMVYVRHAVEIKTFERDIMPGGTHAWDLNHMHHHYSQLLTNSPFPRHLVMVKTPENKKVVESFRKTLKKLKSPLHKHFRMPFRSESELVNFVQHKDYGKGKRTKIAAAIVFYPSKKKNKFKFAIRMAPGLLGPADLPSHFNQPVDTLSNAFNNEEYGIWAMKGFLTLQDTVESFILQKYTPGNYIPNKLLLQPFPVDETTKDKFAQIVKRLIGPFFTLSFLYVAFRIIKDMVQEKEFRIKEGMKMMGLRESVLFLTHFSTQVIQFTLTSFVLTMLTSLNLFQYSNNFIIFLYFFVFELTVFAYAYLISSLFSNAIQAATFGGVCFMLLDFISFALPPIPAASTMMGVCASSPVCFGLGALNIINLEATHDGIQWSNIHTNMRNLSISNCFWMMMLDFVMYLAAGFYLEKVLPGKHGVSAKWWFPFDPKSYGFQRKLQAVMSSGEKPAVNASKFEEVSDHVRQNLLVSVNGLRRTFKQSGGGEFVAVNNIYLDMYKGQILSLLGHNGAGKTTTLNMLCGMLKPTAGDAVLSGLSISRHLKSVRRLLGVCPQHDILFPMLTVKEHMFLYGRLKGIPEAALSAEVSEIIADLALTAKANVESQALSGGQKRKLSVGIALMGDSQVVILDEPTSGMDPYARRFTWDFIKKRKRGRVIILTTHFMDEADYLGDRIAIMADGEIQCCGSSLFLKSRYGVGYTLTFVKQSRLVGNAPIESLVSRHCEGVSVLSSSAGEIVFRLPFDESPKFPNLFDACDRDSEIFGIQSYSISVTTLEEVFLRVAKGEGNEEDVEIMRRKSAMNVRQIKSARLSTMGDLHDSSEFEMNGTEDISFWRHFRALLIKRFHVAKRDRQTVLFQLVLPLVLLIAGCLACSLASGVNYPPVTFDYVELYNTPLPVPIASTDPALGLQFKSFLKSKTLRPLHVPSRENGKDFAGYLLDLQRSYDSMYGAFFLGEPFDDGKHHMALPVLDHMKNTFDDAKRALFPNLSLPVPQMDIIMFNTTARDSLPLYFNMYHTAIGRIRSKNKTFSIKVVSSPLPFDAEVLDAEESLIGVVIGIGFAFIPANFVALAVTEAFTKAKHLQEISGVSMLAYWSSMYFWDFVSYMITGSLALGIFKLFRLKIVADVESTLACLAHIVMYGVSSPLLAYNLSFVLKNPGAAQVLALTVFVFSGAVLLILSVVLCTIPEMVETNRKMMNFYALFPPWALSGGMMGVSLRDNIYLNGRVKEIWEWDVSGRTVTFMALESVVFCVSLIVIESIRANPHMMTKLLTFIAKFGRTPQIDQAEREEDEDSDVENESSRVRDSPVDAPVDDIIQLRNLRKVYSSFFSSKTKVAVDDLCFGIPEGEIFGFLGINGAGKTTTLKMLTVDHIPTSGTALLGGKSILTEQGDVRRLLGYCPQFDALIDQLTSRETLTLFARIKNVPEEAITPFVDDLIKKVGLSKFADRPCGGYSGGNKRKLSVGIALIGDPKIVFLDEPSTGMDPYSRRFMWDLISSTMMNRSVILTTHSMEECQALCNRIGIMVAGRLRCLGSMAHLQSKFGNGYQLDFNTGVRAEDVSALKTFVETSFHGASLLEIHGSSVKYMVPKSEHSLGKIFRLIEENTKTVNIVDYSVSEVTLEQIFIQFARKSAEFAPTGKPVPYR